MKKIGIFCAALLALGFTACDDTSDLGTMQVNAPEAVMEANGIGINYDGGFNSGTIDLTGQEGKNLDLFKWNVVNPEKPLPENAYPQFRLRVAADQNFTNPVYVALADVENTPNQVVVSADALNDAVVTLFGRNPIPRTTWIAVESYIIDGTQLVLGSAAIGAKSVNIKPMLDAAYAGIEPAYYFMTSLDGMTIDRAVKMSHSDAHQYDDPLFNYVFDLTQSDVDAGAFKWMIVPESAYNTNNLAGCFGVAPGTEADVLTGELVLGGQPGEILAASKYLFVIDMYKKTYEFSYAADHLYVWTARGQFNSACLLTTDDNVHFSGAAVVTGNWKLTANKDFNGLQFGRGAGLEDNQLKAGKASTPFPVTADERGLKWFDVDLASLTFSMQNIKTLGIIGSLTAWGNLEEGGIPDIEMTPSADFFTWTATDVVVAEKGEFKIRSNGNWDGFNLGGDLDNLTYGGDNIAIEPGKYDMVLTIGLDHKYTLTITKK